MQTTLLGLAIALILALVAALVAPLMIDWGRFRPSIEAEATRLIGTPVRVTGDIEAALLPTPSLTLHGIEAGPADDSKQIHARSLSIEFYLGSLMRGQWRARELRLMGPDLNLGLTTSGQLALPPIATGFDPTVLSIEHLNIEDGHAVLTDVRSGSHTILDKVWFNGDVRSLLGPLRGDGAFVVGGKLYGYRISAGRVDEAGLKLKFDIDPIDRPLAVDADGVLSFKAGAPQFEGVLTLARPAGLALPNGQTVINDPWRMAAQVKATPTSALLQQIDFQYGPEERAIKLGGTAEVKFGNKPRIDGVLSATQLDLDRAFAKSDAPRPLPFAAVKSLGESLSGLLGPSLPARLGISVDLLTLAGANVHSLRGDLTTNGETWNLEDFGFRVPGFTQINLSGRLDLAGERPAFMGPVAIDSSDPSAFVSWLEGTTYPDANPMKPLSLRGEVTFSDEKLAIDHLDADIDQKKIEGRLAYMWPNGTQAARIDAELRAAELNLDALTDLGKSAQGVSKFEMPRDVSLAVAIGHARLAGVDAREVDARLHRDAGRLQIDRFSVADLGGAAFSASGHVDTSGAAPSGKLNLHLDARELGGMVALLDKFVPQAADSARQLAQHWRPAQLDVTLDLATSGSATTAKLSAEGRSGAIRLSLLGDAGAASETFALSPLAAIAGAKLRLQGQFDSEDGSAIVDLLGLRDLVTVSGGHPGQFSFAAAGPLGRDLEIEGKLLAGGVNATANGLLHLSAEQPTANLRLNVAAADAMPLIAAKAARLPKPLPVTLIGDLQISPQAAALANFSGTVAGRSARGNLKFTFGQPLQIEGGVEADGLELPAAFAAAIGVPSPKSAAELASAWPAQPFAKGLFFEVDGRVQFKLAQVMLTPTLALREAKGVAQFNSNLIALRDIHGMLADGQFDGQLDITKNGNAVSANARLHLANADAAALLAAYGHGGLAGHVSLRLETNAAGTTPRELIEAMSGSGTVSLTGAKFMGFDGKVFDAAIQAVDRGMNPQAATVNDFVAAALDKAQLPVASAEGAVTIAAGQVRVNSVAVQAEDATLTVNGTADLVGGELNARLALSPDKPAPNSAAERPIIVVSLKGRMDAPQRSVDASSFATWLTMRSVDLQAKRLEAIEAQRRLSVEKPPGASPPAREKESFYAPPPSEGAPPLPMPIEIPVAPGAAAAKSATLPAATPGSATPAKPKPAKPLVSPLPLRPELPAGRDH